MLSIGPIRVRLELDRGHGGTVEQSSAVRWCSGRYSTIQVSLRVHAASAAHRDVDALLG